MDIFVGEFGICDFFVAVFSQLHRSFVGHHWQTRWIDFMFHDHPLWRSPEYLDDAKCKQCTPFVALYFASWNTSNTWPWFESWLHIVCLHSADIQSINREKLISCSYVCDHQIVPIRYNNSGTLATFAGRFFAPPLGGCCATCAFQACSPGAKMLWSLLESSQASAWVVSTSLEMSSLKASQYSGWSRWNSKPLLAFDV